MGSRYKARFDLPTLLRMGDLDIINTAQNNLMLTVGEYNSMLERFKYEAPVARESMAKISSHTAAKADSYTLSNIKVLLEEIGYIKLKLIFSDIIEAMLKGNMDFAADCTKSIMGKFNDLYNRIMLAERSEELTDVLSSDETVNEIKAEPPSAQTLMKVLDKLLREEETRKMRILAVDDSPVILNTITSILGEDYKVYGITNPLMVETFLKKIVPELFLFDYKMPALSGFELISIIRNFEEHKETPVIIVTSMGTIDYISASHSLGACDFIVKPVQENTLLEKVAKHIVKKKLF